MAEAQFLEEIETGSNAEKSKEILAQVKPDRRQKLVSSVTKSGLTVAHWACLNNNLDLLKVLRLEDPELKVDVPIKRAVPRFRAFSSIPKGSTPLHCACMVNSPECARFLLDSEVDVNACDALGRTPLFTAAFYNNIDVLSMIANHPNVKPDFELAITSDEGGLPIGCTALMAASSGNVACVAELLTHFANPDAVDANGWAAIHYATRVANIPVLKKLVASEANVNLQTTHHLFKPPNNPNGKPKLEAAAGSSALHIAVKYANDKAAKKQLFIDCIAYLVQNGCKPNVQDIRGWSPAMSICLTGDQALLDTLITEAKKKHVNIDFSLESREKVQVRVPQDPSASAEISRRAMSFSMSTQSPLSQQMQQQEETTVVELPAGSTAWDIGRARQAMGCLELLVLAEVEAEDSDEEDGYPSLSASLHWFSRKKPTTRKPFSNSKDPVKQYMIKNIQDSKKLQTRKRSSESGSREAAKAAQQQAVQGSLAIVQSENVNLKQENSKLAGDLQAAKDRERQAIQDLISIKEEQARIDVQADLMKERAELEDKINRLTRERDLALATARDLTRGARGREITSGMSRSYTGSGSMPAFPVGSVGSFGASTTHSGYRSPTNSPPDSPPPPGARMIVKPRDRNHSTNSYSGMSHMAGEDSEYSEFRDDDLDSMLKRKAPQRADGRPMSEPVRSSRASTVPDEPQKEEGCCKGCNLM